MSSGAHRRVAATAKQSSSAGTMSSSSDPMAAMPAVDNEIKGRLALVTGASGG